MGALTKKLGKYLSQYLSTTLVLVMDVFLSSVASAIVIFAISLFFGDERFSGVFVVTWLGCAVIFSLLLILLSKQHKVVIRHMTLRDFGKYALVIACKDVLLAVITFCFLNFDIAILTISATDFLVSLFFIFGARVVMVFVYDILRERIIKNGEITNVLIYGTQTKATSLVTRLLNSPDYKIEGLISNEPVSKGTTIMDVPVYYFDTYGDLKVYMERNGINAILFAHEKDAHAERDGLIAYCTDNHIKVLICPSIDEVTDGKFTKSHVREIKIEDLLGRSEIKINMDQIKSNFGGKVVMVTGAAGSIGSELVRQLATFNVKKLVLFDNAETPMHNLRLELEDKFPDLDFVPMIGDVRLEARLDYAFRRWKPQVVFHAAAYKHVPLMEENPCEAVLVNVHGSRNVADKCIQYGVEKMVMISTDKAVNPTNIMGCTKRLAEIYVQSLGLAIEKGEYVMPEGSIVDKPVTKFVTTRFGNVLGSNGSVIPRFREQILRGGPVTVTHPQITRFFMTIPEACRLVMEAATMSTGNQIFVFDMGKSVKIDSLARRMISLAGFVPDKDIMVEYTGLRPGEKLYEEVLSNAENTEPTNHDRIRVAKVREYNYEDALVATNDLTAFSREVDIPDMIRLMKKTVPEFKSKNSRFEAYDLESESGGGGTN